MVILSSIGSFFGSIIGALAKWASTIMGFASGAYWQKNRANKRALEIKDKQLKIAGRHKYRRDELIAKAKERKR